MIEMVEVESSNVAAIGYSAECRLLRVLYRDGSTYDYPNVSEAQYAYVMGAPSKGRAIQELRRHGTRLTDGETIKLREPATPIATGLLQMIESDECCTPRFAKEARTGSLDKAESWICPKCGVEYRPQIVDGTVRHWVAHITVSIVRPR